MKCVIIGMGVQGQKRFAVARENVVATVDPVLSGVSYKSIKDVPLDIYDAALLCIPDNSKMSIVKYLLSNKKHILVEKPLFANKTNDLQDLKKII